MPTLPDRYRECHRRGHHYWNIDLYNPAYGHVPDSVWCRYCGYDRPEDPDAPDFPRDPPNIGRQVIACYGVAAVFTLLGGILLSLGLTTAGALLLAPGIFAFLVGFVMLFCLAAGVE